MAGFDLDTGFDYADRAADIYGKFKNKGNKQKRGTPQNQYQPSNASPVPDTELVQSKTAFGVPVMSLLLIAAVAYLVLKK